MPTPMTETTPSALAVGPWKAERLPQGWDWIPGYGLFEQTDATARRNSGRSSCICAGAAASASLPPAAPPRTVPA